MRLRNRRLLHGRVVSLPDGFGHAVPGARLRVAAAKQPGVNPNRPTDETALDRFSDNAILRDPRRADAGRRGRPGSGAPRALPIDSGSAWIGAGVRVDPRLLPPGRRPIYE